MNPYDYHDRKILLQTQAATIFDHLGIPTFCSALRIERARIGAQAIESLAIAEEIFRDWKCPDTRETLVGCVEQVLAACNRSGVLFPAVFLMRLKQLSCGEFVPQQKSFPLFEVKA